MIQAKTHGTIELIFTGHVSVAKNRDIGDVARCPKLPAVVLCVEQRYAAGSCSLDLARAQPRYLNRAEGPPASISAC